MNGPFLDELILRALKEDLGERGDLTTDLVLPEEIRGKAGIWVKEEAILCGVGIASRVLTLMDPSLYVIPLYTDGDMVSPQTLVMEILGDLRSIFSAERTALNFLGRLSGIATLVRKFVEALEGTSVELLDTRKTTPGLRKLEKYAVRVGGGKNHRMGLFDGILIKDNHIRAVGSVSEAVRKAKANAPHGLKVEAEVQTLKEVEEALEAGADILLLDNMDLETVRQAVQMIRDRALVEVSGGITLENVRSYAEAGVDYISVGALTHQARWIDFSLEVIEVWKP